MNLFGWLARKEQALDADGVMIWISTQSPAERERLAYMIVRRVYDGKRNIHRNPRSKQEINAERMESLARVNAAMDARGGMLRDREVVTANGIYKGGITMGTDGEVTTE